MASMWPRLISRGNGATFSPDRKYRCFNVAAADQPRKRLIQLSRCRRHGFNVAAADQPRKLTNSIRDDFNPGLQCGRG